jgi:hypothetical protein
MDHDGDVERLFSWLQTPDLRYREFAGEREISDATANWPALRRAASTALPDAAATGAEPAAAAPEVLSAPPVRGALAVRLRETIGRATPFAEDHRHFTDRSPDWRAAAPDRAPPRRRPILTTAAALEPGLEPTPPPHTDGARTRETHAGLFGGAYRGFEDAPAEPAGEPPPDQPGHPRSLDAVFSRLARPTRPHHGVDGQAARRSELGPLFRRLR